MITFLDNAVSEIFFFLTLKKKATCYSVAFVQRAIPVFIVNSLLPVLHRTSGSSPHHDVLPGNGSTLGIFSMSFLFVCFVLKNGPKLNHGRAISLKGPGGHKLEKRLTMDITSRLQPQLSSGHPAVTVGKRLGVFLGSLP